MRGGAETRMLGKGEAGTDLRYCPVMSLINVLQAGGGEEGSGTRWGWRGREKRKTGYMQTGSSFSCCPAPQDRNSFLPELSSGQL